MQKPERRRRRRRQQMQQDDDLERAATVDLRHRTTFSTLYHDTYLPLAPVLWLLWPFFRH
jgi:hypothetical protein